MRNEMEELLKEELRIMAIRTRDFLHITQKEMAKRLVMSESSYSDIETGKTMCGTLTATLLLGMQDDVNSYLHHLQVKFENKYNKEMQAV